MNDELQNLGWYVQNVKIEQNVIKNGKIILQDIKKAEVIENTFNNCEFELIEENVELINNNVE